LSYDRDAIREYDDLSRRSRFSFLASRISSSEQTDRFITNSLLSLNRYTECNRARNARNVNVRSDAVKFPNPTHIRKSNRMFKHARSYVKTSASRPRNDFSSLGDRSARVFAVFVITRIHRGNCILHAIVSSTKEDHADHANLQAECLVCSFELLLTATISREICARYVAGKSLVPLYISLLHRLLTAETFYPTFTSRIPRIGALARIGSTFRASDRSHCSCIERGNVNYRKYRKNNCSPPLCASRIIRYQRIRSNRIESIERSISAIALAIPNAIASLPVRKDFSRDPKSHALFELS